MRNIKFRAKAVGSNRWLYGNLVWTGSQRTEPHIIEDWSADEDSAISVDEHTLGMNTGLFDKNHKEIFLGDIIAHCGKVIGHVVDGVRGYCFDLIYKNSFPEKSCSLYFVIKNDYCDDVEVVGNIYDNPEFVKGGAE